MTTQPPPLDGNAMARLFAGPPSGVRSGDAHCDAARWQSAPFLCQMFVETSGGLQGEGTALLDIIVFALMPSISIMTL